MYLLYFAYIYFWIISFVDVCNQKSAERNDIIKGISDSPHVSDT